MEAFVANPVCTNFKALYDRYELYVIREIEGIYVTQAMNDMVNYWRQGTLEPKEHEHYFVNVGLPKVATKMVRTRYINEALTHSIYQFIRKTLVIAIELMPQNITPYSEFLTYAMDHGSAFFSSKRMPTHLQVKFAAPTAPLPSILPSTSSNQENLINNSSDVPPSSTETDSEIQIKLDAITNNSNNDNTTSSSTTSTNTNPFDANTSTPHAPIIASPPQNLITSAAGRLVPSPNSVGSYDDEPVDSSPYATLYQTLAHFPSEYFPDLLNYFGIHGGYTAIFNQIYTDTTPVIIIANLLYALRNAYTMAFVLPKRMVQFNIKVLSMSPLVNGLSQSQLKGSKREDLELMLRHLTGLLKFTMTMEDVTRLVDQFGLRIAAQCLSSGVITQRLFALNFLGTAIDAVLPRHHKSSEADSKEDSPKSSGSGSWLTVPNLIQWIQSSQILTHLFGDSSHSQLLKNSNKLMRFLSQYDGLSAADIELVWKCSNNAHESLALDAMNVFFDIVPLLHPQLVESVISSLDQLVRSQNPQEGNDGDADPAASGSSPLNHQQGSDHNEEPQTNIKVKKSLSESSSQNNLNGMNSSNTHQVLTSRDLSTMATLANRLMSEEQKLKMVSLLLFVFEFGHNDLNIEVSNHLTDIFNKDWFRTHRLQTVIQLMEALNREGNDNRGRYCSLIDTILGTWTREDPTTHDSLFKITHRFQCSLDTFFIDELLRFKDECLPMTTPETYEASAGELYLAGRQSYLREIQCRLYLLYHLFVQGNAQLSKQSMVKLFDCLYHNAVCFGEAEECFEWFKAAAAEGSVAIPSELADVLFQARLSELNFQYMTPGGYTCFERYFVHSNLVAQKMARVQPKQQQNGNNNNNNQNNQDADFVVLTHPDQLVGEKCLWDIALTNNDPHVVQNSLQLLIRCMEQLDANLQLELSPLELRESFIAKCLGRIPEWVAHYQAMPTLTASTSSSNAEDDEYNRRELERLISGSLSLLVTLMDNLESASSKRGTITRGLPLNLIIKSILEIPTSVLPSDSIKVDFTLPVDATMSFSTVQKLIVDRLASVLKQNNVTPEDLVYVQTYPWYRRLDNDVSVVDSNLSALELYDRDVIEVRSLPSIKGRETVLRSRKGKSFKQEEKARPQDAEHRIMQIVEFVGWPNDLAEYALKSNGWDVEQVGNIIMDEGRRNKLVNDARKAGIGRASGEKSEEEHTQSAKEIVTIMKQRTDSVLSMTADDGQSTDASLPSVILSTTKVHFDTLFSLLGMGNDRISQSVWDIILRIPTSLSIKASLLSNDEHPDWQTLLPNDVYRLHYTAQIIDQILCPLDDSWQLTRRLEWAQWFQRTGGLIQLIKVIGSFDTKNASEPYLVQNSQTSSNSQQQQGELDMFSQMRRDCLATVLKILDAFLSPFVASLGLTPSQDHSLRTSSQLLVETLSLDPTAISAAAASTHNATLQSSFASVMQKEITSLIPNDTQPLVDHLLEILTWSVSTNPPVANAALSCYIWRAFVHISIISQHKSQNSSSPILNKNVLNLIMQVILDPSPEIRRECATNAYNLALYHAPSADILLDWVKSFLPKEDTIKDDHTETAGWYDRFFWLLERLVKLRIHRLQEKLSGESLGTAVVKEFGDLSKQLVRAIHLRPLVEAGSNAAPDWMLNGALRTLTGILTVWPNAFGASDLITELYHGCMFNEKSTGRVPKCKTYTTRSSTYDLLFELSRLSDDNKKMVLNLIHSNHSSVYQKMSTWEFHPGNEDKSAAGYVGLINLGATCYMNSLLQQFYMMPTLRRDLLAAPVVLGPTDPLKENMVYQFHNLLGNLQESQKEAINPRDFTSSCRDIEGNPTDVSTQQDVSEFFNLVCGSLESQLKGTSEERLLQRNLGCTQVSQIKSMEPEFPYISERDEELYAIPLEIHLKNNFDDAMDLFVKQALLDGDNKYKCDQYDRHIVASKGNLIKTMSNTLIFHLMRFDFDLATYKKRKLNDYFSFPHRINMKKWTKSGQAEMQARGDANSSSPQPPEFPDSYYEFQLTGVLVHTGSADSGHYYSLIRERQSPFKWYQFNDRVVSEFNPEHINQECFGGYHSVKEWDSSAQKEVWHDVPTERSAYMLFYERIVPVPEENTSSPTPPELTGGRRILRPSSYTNGVPTEVHNRVWEENLAFMKTRQVFDPAYFEFMRKYMLLWNSEPVFNIKDQDYEDLISLVPLVNPETGVLANHDLAAFKVFLRIAVEVLAHSRDNLLLTSFLGQLSQAMSFQIPASVWFVEYVRKNNIVKDLMLNCSVERTRIAFADFFSQVLNSLASCQVQYAPPLINKSNMTYIPGPVIPQDADAVLMGCFFELLEESRGAWRRFKQYFGVIRDYALIGTPQRQWLLNKSMISLWVDYFMGQSNGGVSRARVMDEDHFPDLGEFIDGLTTIVCSCKNENPYNDNPNANGVPSGAPKRNRFQKDSLEMSPTAKNDLYIANDFFTSLLEMDYNSPSTADMLEYVCWYCPARTDFVLDVLLTKIDVQPSENKAPVFEYLLYRILSIDDDLRPKRVAKVMSKSEVPSSLGNISYTNKSVKGLLLLAQSHANATIATLSMVAYMRLLALIPACMDYLTANQLDMLWIRKFWKQQFDTQFPNIPCESYLAGDAEAGLHGYFSSAADITYHRHPSHPSPANAKVIDQKMINEHDPWRISIPYLGLVYCTHIAQVTGYTEPAYEELVINQERELVKLKSRIAELEREHKTLVKALVFVHEKYPTAKLEPKLQMKVEDIIRHDMFSFPSNSRITSSGKNPTYGRSTSTTNGISNTTNAASNNNNSNNSNNGSNNGNINSAEASPSKLSTSSQTNALSPGNIIAVTNSNTNGSNNASSVSNETKSDYTPSAMDIDPTDPQFGPLAYPSDNTEEVQPPVDAEESHGHPASKQNLKISNANNSGLPSTTNPKDSVTSNQKTNSSLNHSTENHSKGSSGVLNSSEDGTEMILVHSRGSDDDVEALSQIPAYRALLSSMGVFGIPHHGSDGDDDSAFDADETSGMFPSYSWRPGITIPSVTAPADLEDRIGTLKAIAPEQNDDVLKLLLEENHWNVESSANDLFDMDNMQRLQKKAAKMREGRESGGANATDQELDDGEMVIHHGLSDKQPRL